MEEQAFRTIAVTSGKGGTGKTSVACSLAVTLAGMGEGRKVLLFDADFGLPNADVTMGVEVGCTLGHVVRERRELRDAVTATPWGVDLISGGSGWPELAGLGASGIGELLAGLSALGSGYDHVVVDTAPGVGARVQPLLEAADLNLLVVTPDATALMDGYAVLKCLWSARPGARAGLVVNQVDGEEQGRHVAKQLRTIVGQFLSQDLSHCGTVRRDGHVGKALRERRPFAKGYPHCAASLGIDEVAECSMKSGK